MQFLRKWISSLIPILLIAVIAGCDDNEEIKPEVKLTVSPESISAEAAGGSFKVNYLLEGVADGEKPQIKCDEPWVNGFDMSKAGEISFSVDVNEEETLREAKVELTYDEVRTEFTVTQAGAPHVPGLTIKIKEIYDAGVLYGIVPEDPNMTYVSMVAEKSYFDSFETEDAFFNEELKYFEDKAEASKLQLSEYLATILKKGEVSGPAYRLKPEKEYYIYAYGMTAEGVRLTKIFKEEFTTIAVEPSDVVLNIDYIISGTTVTMTVTPSDLEHLYLFNAISAAEVTDDNVILNAAQREIDQYIEYYEVLFGVPQDEAVKRFASKGVTSYTFESLSPETEYIGYAVALNRLGSICSDVVSKSFVTETEISDEDLIKLTLTNLTDREVTVQATTTISDHYVIGVDKSARWNGMTDDQIVETLVAGYQWQAKGGTGNGTYTFWNLTPQTDYSIFSFGYVGGVATTKLCRLDFTTDDASGADIVFKMVYDKYYDGDEMALTHGSKYNEAKGKAVLPVRLETEGTDECAEVYYLFYDGNYSDKEKYPDDYFMADLLEYGEWQYNNCYYPEYDKPYTMIGFGATANMAIGPVSRQVVTLSRDGVSPASEFPAAASMNISKGKVLRNSSEKTSLTKLLPVRSKESVNEKVPRIMPYTVASFKNNHNPRHVIK